MNDSSSRHILIVIGLAFGMLLLTSAFPWGELTGNVIKDFDLFEDVFPHEYKSKAVATQQINDPELAEILGAAGDATDGQQGTGTPGAAAVADTTAADSDSLTVVPVTEEMADSLASDTIGGIENYGKGAVLHRFKAALAQAVARRVRVGIIGDSFIEGDILAADLRDLLQQRYGGSGVGYMAMHSDFPGFRKSVRQRDNGWKMHDIRSLSRHDTLRTLSGDYAIGMSGANVKYNATGYAAGTKGWDNSSFSFIAPVAGTIALTIDGDSRTFEIEGSGEVQTVELTGATTSLAVNSDIEGLVGLGAYLDGTVGVQVDCMSIRGNSGLSHRRLSIKLCRQMAQYADYDLIIVEFGTNALSAEQTDYTPYMEGMFQSIRRLQECYPDADILVMSVGDRGVKDGSAVKSLPTCTAMVKAQRELARRTASCFWDTRKAMGGSGASADWRKRHLMNADYIHLNHDGGRELAKLLYSALEDAIDE